MTVVHVQLNVCGCVKAFASGSGLQKLRSIFERYVY